MPSAKAEDVSLIPNLPRAFSDEASADILGFTAITIKNSPADGKFGRRIEEIVKWGPTIYPLLFAALMSRSLKSRSSSNLSAQQLIHLESLSADEFDSHLRPLNQPGIRPTVFVHGNAHLTLGMLPDWRSIESAAGQQKQYHYIRDRRLEYEHGGRPSDLDVSMRDVFTASLTQKHALKRGPTDTQGNIKNSKIPRFGLMEKNQSLTPDKDGCQLSTKASTGGYGHIFSSIAQKHINARSFSDPIAVNYWLNRETPFIAASTKALVDTGHKIYNPNYPWCILLIISSTTLIMLGIAGIFCKIRAATPNMFDPVIGWTYLKPYIPLPEDKENVLAAEARIGLLGKMKVRVGIADDVTCIIQASTQKSSGQESIGRFEQCDKMPSSTFGIVLAVDRVQQVNRGNYAPVPRQSSAKA
ncbi:hypothetical protein KEM54_001262 [Ascosphaera aggregata]|nr:hypothetical protein KEM54_001262 [Ascosphaera aggregata]